MDNLNHKLLELLKVNARTSTAALARTLGLSRTAVQQRIERLERDQVIAGYTLRLGSGASEELIQAVVMIQVDPKQTTYVTEQLGGIEQVKSLYSINGQFDLMARVAAASPQALDQVLDRLGEVKGIEKTLSSILLSTRLER